MLTIADLINRLGGNVGFAEIIGAAHPSTASEMKRRGSIPVQHWPRVIAAARQRGIDISAETLMAMHTEERAA
jgi:hypothetical protein